MPITQEDFDTLMAKVQLIGLDKTDLDNKTSDRVAKSLAADDANEKFHQSQGVETAASGKLSADFAELRAFVEALEP